jgi:hypothetical protein
MAVAVDCLYHFGLIQEELLSTDGQLEPTYSRYKGCTYACEDCQAVTLRAYPNNPAARNAMRAQAKCRNPI